MNAELANDKAAEAPAASDGLPKPRIYAAIAAVAFGTTVTSIDGTIATIALPTLSRELHVQPSAAVLVVTVYNLIMMMTLLPLSALGQRLGLRAAYNTGLSVFAGATVFCFFAHSLPFLLLVRALQALGCAAAASVSSAQIRNIYPLSRLGRGLSLNTVIAASASSLAPTVGGMILSVAAWPWLFAAVAPCALLAVAIGRTSLPETPRHEAPYDVLGAVMCAATFGLVVFGLGSAIDGDSPVISAALVAAGIALGFKFVRRELRQTLPVLPVDLLRIKEIALPCMGSLSAYLGMTIVLVSLPFRLQQQFHFSPAAAGAVLVPMPLVSVVVAPTSGLLSDRIPAGLLGGIGMAIGFISMIFLALLPAAPSEFAILWRVALCGLGFGMFFSPNARQVLGAAPAARAAAAGALFSTLRGAGQTLGATVIAALLAMGAGIGPVPGLMAAGFTFIAGICSVAVLRRRGTR
jgi:DHA2 family multidrug resistance protein-like MFS transporter